MHAPRLTRLIYAIFFLSGAAGLGYQMAWTRMFSVALGHEMPAVLAVVAAFFGGLALGAWLLDATVSRSTKPGHWYVGLELLIGSWGFISMAAIPWANRLAGKLIGVDPSPSWQWLVSFGLPLVVLLPATTAMGATLPAIERFAAPLTGHGRIVGGLYAANTAGAVAGTLLSSFLIIPAFGYAASVITLAVVNLLCAIAILPLLGQRDTTPHVPPPTMDETTQLGNVSRRRLLWMVFFTGLLGIGYEVVGVRVLGQVLENTVYSYAAVLSVYLLGTAIGASVYQKYAARGWQSDRLLGYLLCGLAITCMAGGFTMSVAESLYMFIRLRLGDSMLAVMFAEMVIAAAVFLMPTLFMGATFSHLVQEARHAGGGVGQAMALNTVGGFFAPLLFGVLLLPAIGAKWALVVVALGYIPLVPNLGSIRTWLLAVAPAMVLLLPANLRLVNLSDTAQMVEYHEGVMAAVAVIGQPNGHKVLRVNNNFTMGGTATRRAELRQGHLPLLLHEAPRRALFLGLGTGITFQAASYHPDLRAEGVELVPEVVKVLPHFQSPDDHLSDDRLRIHTADARRFVRATEDKYDVVVADLFHPGRDGGGMLYTREHFETIRQLLNEDALFCQWLPMYQLDEPTLRIVIKTFLEVFPNSRAILSTYGVRFPALGLICSNNTSLYPVNWYEKRVRDAGLKNHLQQMGLGNDFELFGTFVADAKSLHRFAGEAQVNTDNHPVVVFQAPNFAYRLRVTGYGRLFSMLEQVSVEPDSLIIPSSESEQFTERLAKYIEARDIFLRAGALLDRSQWVEQVLRSTGVNSDFSTAYNTALSYAEQQSKSDSATAKKILERLHEISPQRREAGELLERLPAELSAE